MNTFNIILEIVGTFAFAVSGIKTASSKNFDWFGAYVVGVATAIGGGTIRDIMLGLPIFWMRNPFYLIISALALVYGILQHRYKSTSKQRKTILLFDTLGLALFTIVGIQKTEHDLFRFPEGVIFPLKELESLEQRAMSSAGAWGGGIARISPDSLEYYCFCLNMQPFDLSKFAG